MASEPAPERPGDPAWHARIQELTGKGPDEMVEVVDRRPLSFFKTHRPLLHFGPSIEWTSIEDGTRVSVRPLGSVDRLAFWEVTQDTSIGEAAWGQSHNVLLLAGLQDDQLLPVHILNTNESIIRRILPMKAVQIGPQTAIKVEYTYEGTGGHRAEYSYIVHEGRPVDLEIGQALLQGDLPPSVSEDWVRFIPRHHRWLPPEWESHPAFDESTLRGYLFLTTKSGDRFCWFEATYRIIEGRLRLRGVELSDCPPSNEWCRAGEP